MMFHGSWSSVSSYEKLGEKDSNVDRFRDVSFKKEVQMILKCNRVGFENDDIGQNISKYGAEYNASEFEKIYLEEKKKIDENITEDAFTRSIKRYLKKPILISIFCYSIGILLLFMVKSYLFYLLLLSLEQEIFLIDIGYKEYILVPILFLSYLGSGIFQNIGRDFIRLNFYRLMGATQYLGYAKVLRLASPKSSSYEELITYCTTDIERIRDALILYVTVFGLIPLQIASVVFLLWIAREAAIVGLIVLLLVFPILNFLKKNVMKVKQTLIPLTSERVIYIKELVNYIKPVKMYAWERAIKAKVDNVRTEELVWITKLIFITLQTSDILTLTTLMAIILTFITMAETGFVMTAPVGYAIFSTFSTLQQTLLSMPLALRSMAEARVSFKRLATFLELPEHEPRGDGPIPPGSISIKNADVFANLTPRSEVSPGRETGNSKFYKKGSSEKKSKDEEKVPLKDSLEKAETYSTSSTQTLEILKEIDLDVTNGQLVGVVGAVGCGKSSVLSALLNELQWRGQMISNGRFALVMQQAWTFSGTIRENILFGLEYDAVKYEKVIADCALEDDFLEINGGDSVHIGGAGGNLSGGQMQRLNLARAVYAQDETEIFLLDSPTSALDSKVGNHVFRYAIYDSLKKKTVVLITANAKFLKECDFVVYMKKGIFFDVGTHQDLLDKHQSYSKILSVKEGEEEPADFDSTPRPIGMDAKTMTKEENRLQKKIEYVDDRERSASFRASLSVLGASMPDAMSSCSSLHQSIASLLDEFDEKESGSKDAMSDITFSKGINYFIKSCGGYCGAMSILFLGACGILLSIGTTFMIMAWMRDQITTAVNNGEINNAPYEIAFLCLWLLICLVGVIKAYFMSRFLSKGDTVLHEEMVERLIKSPMLFYDTVSVGSIINRFVIDLDEVEMGFPPLLDLYLANGMGVFFCLLVPSIFYPSTILTTVIIVFLMYYASRLVFKCVNDSAALQSTAASHLIHELISSVAGVEIIRAFKKEDMFLKRMNARLNTHLFWSAVNLTASLMLRFTAEVIGSFLLLFIGIAVIYFKERLDPLWAGVAILITFKAMDTFPSFFLIQNKSRPKFDAMLRIAGFVHSSDAYVPEDDGTDAKLKLPPSWPYAGSIQFENARLRYNKNSNPALKNVNVVIPAGTKAIVVGRTGAGKSSLITAIIRLVKLEYGRIIVDGHDIAKISAYNLRSAVSVIPQDPTLLRGTLRYNLDPYEQYDDATIWLALEKAQIKDKVLSFDDPDSGGYALSKCINGEDIFSVGEKQLFCLARAILRSSKLVLLDEATANVDKETDELIQKTIMRECAESTVIAISHRLDHIKMYDKVVVMDNGSVVEYGSLDHLMKNEDSLIRAIIEQAEGQKKEGDIE